MIETLLKNQSSFIYGRKPAGTVPVYALVKNCVFRDVRLRITKNKPILKNEQNTLLQDPGVLSQQQIIGTNDLKTHFTLREQLQQVKYENRNIRNVTFKHLLKILNFIELQLSQIISFLFNL